MLEHLAWLKSAFAPLKWLHALWFDQTGMRIRVPAAAHDDDRILRIGNKGGNNAQLLFAITTTKRASIVITQIEVQFPASLQLKDPGARGFFATATRLDGKLPFRMIWKGEIEVRQDVQWIFALTANAKQADAYYPICIAVHGHRQKIDAGGFHHQGRICVSKFNYLARLVPKDVYFIIPPGHSLGTQQPFLAEGPFFTKNEPAKFEIHETLKDGTALSTKVVLPGNSQTTMKKK